MGIQKKVLLQLSTSLFSLVIFIWLDTPRFLIHSQILVLIGSSLNAFAIYLNNWRMPVRENDPTEMNAIYASSTHDVLGDSTKCKLLCDIIKIPDYIPFIGGIVSVGDIIARVGQLGLVIFILIFIYAGF